MFITCKNFEELYKSKEIHYIYITIEAFKTDKQIKQCYHCQGFGHASKVCKFTPGAPNTQIIISLKIALKS